MADSRRDLQMWSSCLYVKLHNFRQAVVNDQFVLWASQSSGIKTRIKGDQNLISVILTFTQLEIFSSCLNPTMGVQLTVWQQWQCWLLFFFQTQDGSIALYLTHHTVKPVLRNASQEIHGSLLDGKNLLRTKTNVHSLLSHYANSLLKDQKKKDTCGSQLFIKVIKINLNNTLSTEINDDSCCRVLVVFVSQSHCQLSSRCLNRTQPSLKWETLCFFLLWHIKLWKCLW